MNGYYQATIAGEKIGLKFGVRAITLYQEKILEEPLLVDKQGLPNEIGTAWLIYFGYVNNQLIKGERASKPFAFFSEWAEQTATNDEVATEVANILTEFADSAVVKALTGTSQQKAIEGTAEVKKNKRAQKK